MRLPAFDYQAPDRLHQALKIKGEMGAAASILAGGTDLIVNLKHRVLAPATLISLKNVKELRGIASMPDAVVIRAGTTLAEIANNPVVNEHFPVLVKAVRSIGAPGIQAFRGTLGGNICLSPRCLFYNQSLFWRSGKGSCHRTGGKECHALEGSESCQSICSGDTVPVLLALSAQLTLAGPSGTRLVPITQFYTGEGQPPFHLSPEEILTEVRIPLPWARISASYQRLSMRSAVDFPLLNVAAVAIIDKGRVEHFRLVLSAAGPAPIVLKEAEAAIKGSEPNPNMLQTAADIAHRAAEGCIVENASLSRRYRVKMAPVLARRATREAIGL